MIRQPTPALQALAWWREALRDQRQPRHEDEPQCGYYRMKFVKNGPWVPVRIFIRQVLDDHGRLADDELLLAQVANDEPRPAARVWLSCRPISRPLWEALMLNLTPATHSPVNITMPRRPT